MFDAYRVAVQLVLVNRAASGLASIIGQLQGVNRGLNQAQGNARRLQQQLQNIRGLGWGGLAVGMTGAAMLSGVKAPLDAAKNYELAFTRFKTLNLGEEANKQADQYARSMNVMGASSTQLMDTLRESYGMFGNLPMAMQAATKIAALNAANANLFGSGKVGEIDKGAVQSIMRFNDMRGKTNSVEDFMSSLDLAQRMVTGSGGALKFSDLEQFMKRGGVAAKSLSDEGIMMMSTLIQEQGGASTGNAIMSLYQNLIAGRTPVATAAAIARAGLGTLTQIRTGTEGGKEVKKYKITNIKDEELLRTNPGQWLITHGIAAAKASGATTDDQIAKFMNDLVSNRVGSNAAVNFTTQHLQAIRDRDNTAKAMGADATISASGKTLGGMQADLMNKWKTLMTELGLIILPAAIKATEGLIVVVKTLTQFAKDYPSITKGLIGAFTGLGVAMAIGGTVLVATAALKGFALLFGGAVGGAGLVAGLKAAAAAGGGLAALAVPLGLLVAKLALVTAGIYGLNKAASWWSKRDFSQKEIDAVKTDGGVRLSPSAAVRIETNGVGAPQVSPPRSLWQQIKDAVTGDGKPQSHVNTDIKGRVSTGQIKMAPPAKKNAPTFKIENKVDYNGITTRVNEVNGKNAKKPQRGASGFDPQLNPQHLGSGFAGGY